MNGKFYNGSVKCHKAMHEALEMIRFQCFMDNCSPEHASEIESLLCKVRDAFPNEEFYDYLESPELKEMIKEYEKFNEMASKKFPTFALWSTYIKITGILYQNNANNYILFRSLQYICLGINLDKWMITHYVFVYIALT